MSSLRPIEYIRRETCLFDGGEVGSHRLRRVATVSDALTARHFEILYCTRCDAAFTSPYPSEATSVHLYGEGGVSIFEPIRNTVIDRLKDMLAARDLRWVAAKRGRGAVRGLLDYGTGNGRFALVAARTFKGCSVDAVDFGPKAPPGIQASDQSVRYLPITKHQYDDARYDVVVLHHVLEHVHDPVRLLRSLAARLTESGVIYVEVPNYHSAYIRWFGVRTNAFGVPLHLIHFSQRSLRWVVEAAGFSADVSQKELPWMGSVFAALLGQEHRFGHQLVGAALQPLQALLGFVRGKPCLAAVCRRI